MNGHCDVVRCFIKQYGVDPASKAKASHKHAILLYYSHNMSIIQNGIQVIHHAAQEGHEAVVKMLVDDFHVKPNLASNVCLCMCAIHMNTCLTMP